MESNFLTRLITERDELNEKYIKLINFLSKPEASVIEPFQFTMLNIQKDAMAVYLGCLDARISALH